MKDQAIIVALLLAFAWGYGCGAPWPSERVTESECDVAEAVDRLTEAVRDKECACAEDDP